MAARRTAAEGIEARGTAVPAVAGDIAPAGTALAVEDIGMPEDIVLAAAGIDPETADIGRAVDIVAASAGMCRAAGIAAAHLGLKRELQRLHKRA